MSVEYGLGARALGSGLWRYSFGLVALYSAIPAQAGIYLRPDGSPHSRGRRRLRNRL